MHQALITTIPLDGEANNNNSLRETTTKRRGILFLQVLRQHVKFHARRHRSDAVRRKVLAAAGRFDVRFSCLFSLNEELCDA
jgi:hypothetical protein